MKIVQYNEKEHVKKKIRWKPSLETKCNRRRLPSKNKILLLRLRRVIFQNTSISLLSFAPSNQQQLCRTSKKFWTLILGWTSIDCFLEDIVQSYFDRKEYIHRYITNDPIVRICNEVSIMHVYKYICTKAFLVKIKKCN